MEEVRTFLLKEFRWAMDRQKLLAPFLNDSAKIDALVQITKNLEEYPLKEYASYALTHLQKQHVDLSPYRNTFIDVLFLTDNQSVLRNLSNIINQLPFDNYRESEFFDLLLSFIKNPTNKVALHVYSIYNLIHFAKHYPELIEEIRMVIHDKTEQKSPAYKVAVRNFEKAIS